MREKIGSFLFNLVSFLGLILILGVLSLGCLFTASGCSRQTPTTEQIQYFKEVTTFMQENQMAGQVTLHSHGSPEVYQKLSFGADTGISLNVSVQFNPAAVDDVPVEIEAVSDEKD